MIDFTSSHYLGIQYSPITLYRLSTGVPSALYEPAIAKQLASSVTAMQGLGAGFTAPSTLHLYYDLYSLLSKQHIVVFIDEKAYPVSRYGIEKLLLAQIPVYQYRHLDAIHLQERLITKADNRKPVVITDGWCPQCGIPAPIDVYIDILKPYNGIVVIDDTQGIGIFGKRNGTIYGSGGGGLLQWLNVRSNNIISITSLAKAFGIPVAVISANQSFIQSFRNNSITSVFSSPAGLVYISAALQALNINKESGDTRRQKLFNNISLFKSLLAKAGIKTHGGIFPVQSIYFNNAVEGEAIATALKKRGIKTVLTKNHNNSFAVCIVIRADHSVNDIKTLCYHLKRLL